MTRTESHDDSLKGPSYLFALNPRLSALFQLDDGTLKGNAAVFEGLVNGIPDLDCSDDLETVTFWTQVAAHFAWMNHAGVLASLDLEQRLNLVSKFPGIARAASDAPRRPRVLHVLTQAYALGGHTRLAWRWIQADCGRESNVALTRQGWSPIPRHLTEAVSRAGGSLTDLSAIRGGLRARAMALRKLMANADIVILHTHPFDALPILACATWAARPPVLLLNHADHVFWLGVSVSDVVVNIRHSGARLALDRRGVEASRLAVLPIPVALPTVALRAAARAALGLDVDQVVALTVASPYKYVPYDGLDFIETALSILAQTPELTILAIGPSPQGRWAAADAQSGGRLRALGMRSNLDSAFGAADLYLDSFPVSSLTSLLEAGSHGLPLVALRSHPVDVEILGADLPGLEGVLVVAEDREAYASVIRGLAVDRDRRVELGERTMRSIVLASCGDGWLNELESVYAKAVALHAQTQPPTGRVIPPGSGPLDLHLAALNGSGAGLPRAMRAQLPATPLRCRATLTMDLWKAGANVSSKALVPDWARAGLRGLRSGEPRR